MNTITTDEKNSRPNQHQINLSHSLTLSFMVSAASATTTTAVYFICMWLFVCVCCFFCSLPRIERKKIETWNETHRHEKKSLCKDSNLIRALCGYTIVTFKFAIVRTYEHAHTLTHTHSKYSFRHETNVFAGFALIFHLTWSSL